MNDFAQNGMKQEHRLQHMSKIKNDLRQIRLRYNSNVAVLYKISKIQ